jgi:hypothetical protein
MYGTDSGCLSSIKDGRHHRSLLQPLLPLPQLLPLLLPLPLLLLPLLPLPPSPRLPLLPPLLLQMAPRMEH